MKKTFFFSLRLVLILLLIFGTFIIANYDTYFAFASVNNDFPYIYNEIAENFLSA
ncbi:MAG: hypothetical protein LBF68_08725 [Christensenellaceae bacterium]|jgi:hypothetical protein|nr:hypothetical protein [Christensenellaceae bacterium]